jgi:hypothetical protein
MNYPHAQIGQLCLPTEQRDPRDTPYQPFKYVDISSVDKDLKAIVQTQEVMAEMHQVGLERRSPLAMSWFRLYAQISMR